MCSPEDDIYPAQSFPPVQGMRPEQQTSPERQIQAQVHNADQTQTQAQTRPHPCDSRDDEGRRVHRPRPYNPHPHSHPHIQNNRTRFSKGAGFVNNQAHSNNNSRRGQRQRQRQRSDSRRDQRTRRNNTGSDNKRCERPGALELAMHPRSLDELHAERGYLFYALQSHDQRVLALLWQLNAVDEQIRWYIRFQGGQGRDNVNFSTTQGSDSVGSGNASRERERTRGRREEVREDEEELLRQARRYRAWVRGQIGAVVDDERALYARLGEVNIEIRCQERWALVEQSLQQEWTSWTPSQRHRASRQHEEGGGYYDPEWLRPDGSEAWLRSPSQLSPNSGLGMNMDMSMGVHSYAQGCYETGTSVYAAGERLAPGASHPGYYTWPGVLEEGGGWSSARMLDPNMLFSYGHGSQDADVPMEVCTEFAKLGTFIER
ncbi:hypothetical protein F5Y17DRAFT_459337 [Xylariaceae sp. FL0594]|nr:hypothetical protein F5Y17DRAFT_459337 [Xylariaceae sp. FL0594]